MIPVISDDSKAALLLCGHFFGQREEEPKPLAPREFHDITRWLGRTSLGPAALFDDKVRTSFARETGVSEARLAALIARGGALALAIERWTSRGIWVITRLDPTYPPRLLERLRTGAPVILFGAGSRELLSAGGLALLGSRRADPQALTFTRAVAGQCAREGVQIFSGAARGVDEEAMTACLESGGRATGVVSDRLERLVLSRKYRQAIVDGRAVLISPYHPDAGFNVGNAMARNASIYALADAALVVASELEQGGTWAGATDNLRQRLVPLFVRDAPLPGNQALLRSGGAPWPESGSVASLLRPAVHEAIFDAPQRESLDLFEHVAPHILRALAQERTEKDLAEVLAVEPKQARTWLKRLVAQGKVRKMSKPVRYVASMKLF